MPFPVAVEHVHRAEEELGSKFPASYVVRMCRQNGGTLEAADDCWYLFPIFDDSDKQRLRRTCNDVVRETALAKEWAGFPEGAVAIGSNGTGDKLVLVRDPSDPALLEHAVYWWDHETDKLIQVGDDFADLADA
ncbi:MAG: SMI1/KNR4 family protein [Planctomycetota bacterium]